MAVYFISTDRKQLEPLQPTTFSQRGIKERADLQQLLRAKIEVVAPDVLIIDQEFGRWDVSRLRIDLLGVDKKGDLVVIELKRDDDGGLMDLQAIRYAAMVSTMTFSRAVDVYQAYLKKDGSGQDAQTELLAFLGWAEPREGEFARDVSIVLVAADFGAELTTAVLWLNERKLNIRCVRMKPYANGDQTIVDVQQIVPLPEATEYTVRVRDKVARVRDAAMDTGYWFMNTGDDGTENGRSWEDCSQYGFIQAGGGQKYFDQIKKLKVGDKLFAYLSEHGYVGLGVVTAVAVPFNNFVPSGQDHPLVELKLNAKYQTERMSNPELWDLCAGVEWIKALSRNEAVLRNRSHMGTLCKMRQPDLVADLRKIFDPDNTLG